MDLVQEFRKHANECEQMACTTRDGESRTSWVRLAERWQQCAQRAEQERQAAQVAAMQLARTRKSRLNRAA